jgi:hypothetical protein
LIPKIKRNLTIFKLILIEIYEQNNNNNNNNNIKFIQDGKSTLNLLKPYEKNYELTKYKE